MNIPHFLDLALELETEISKLYETIADRSGDRPIAARLKAIANEELNHANSLRRGKEREYNVHSASPFAPHIFWLQKGPCQTVRIKGPYLPLLSLCWLFGTGIKAIILVCR